MVSLFFIPFLELNNILFFLIVVVYSDPGPCVVVFPSASVFTILLAVVD